VKQVFTLPSLSADELHVLHHNVGIELVGKEALSFLSTLFQTVDAYQNLAMGMNPKRIKRYRSELVLVNDDLHKIHHLVKRMRQHKERYAWNFNLSNHLSQDQFWKTQNLQGNLKFEWNNIGHYSYYSSEDLTFLSAVVFPKLASYLSMLTMELSSVNRGKYRRFQKEINQLDLYVASLKQSFELEQARLARAMLTRLQLAAKYQSLNFDDVMFDFSEQLKTCGFQLDSVSTLGRRPYEAASRGLTPKHFYQFHSFIQQHGDKGMVSDLQKLPWVKQRHYVYNQKKRSWEVGPNIFGGGNIPRSIGWPKRLFRGRNARHQAFHDVTKLIEIRLLSNAVKKMQSQLRQVLLSGLDSEKLQFHKAGFYLVQNEHGRIAALRKNLNRFMHSKSRRVLQAYQDELIQVVEAILLSQLTVLQGAHDSLVRIINDAEKLDCIMQLAEDVSETMVLLPSDHVLVLQALQLQKSVREKVARHKLDAFSLDIREVNFQKRAVYDGKGVVYEIADREVVHNYFVKMTRHLSPEQSEALWFVARILTGEHYQIGRHITYDDIYTAMDLCFDNPGPVVQDIFEIFIAPSVYTTDGVAYQLLVSCEDRIGQDKRSRLLKQLGQRQKEAMFVALRQLFETDLALNEQSIVIVDSREIPLGEFIAMLSVLEKSSLNTLAIQYLSHYQGDHEKLWRLFGVMPKSYIIAYALKRLSYLLEHGDCQSIIDSPCLIALQSAMLEKDVQVNQLLAQFIARFTINLKNISALRMLVHRFGGESIKLILEEKIESFLLQHFIQALHSNDVNAINNLSAYLSQHEVFPSSQFAKDQLALQLQYMPHEAWTEKHHALLDTLVEVDLRQVYLTQLLRRVLFDRQFSSGYGHLLPGPEDFMGCYEVMTAAGFKEICQEALEYFSAQQQIDNLSGFRVLANLLMHDLVATLDFEDLHSEMKVLLVRFKQQLNVEMLAREIIHLIDQRQIDIAKEKLSWLKDTLLYYTSIEDKKSCAEIKRAIEKIIENMSDRVRCAPTDKQWLDPDTAGGLLGVMPEIDSVALLRWRLENHDLLLGLVTRLQQEIWYVGNGKSTVLSSMPLFLEAIRRGELNLTTGQRQDLVTALGSIIEGEQFTTLPEPAKIVLTALMQLLLNKDKVENTSVLLEYKQVSTEKEVEPEPVETRKGSVPAFIVDGLEVVSQQIIMDLQNDGVNETSIRLMKDVFLASRGSQSLKEAVANDLLLYMKTLFSEIIREENTPLRRKAALRLLDVMRWAVSKVDPLPNFPFVFLIQRWDQIELTINRSALSLKDLYTNAKKEFPELNEFLLQIIDGDFLDDTTREEWIAFLGQVLLPYLENSSNQLTPQLSAALSSFYRLLKNDASEEDRRHVIAYGKHYNNVVAGSIHHTQSVRIGQQIEEGAQKAARLSDNHVQPSTSTRGA